jgi:hypothetical protein
VLDDCYHMVTLDKQRHTVAERSRAFIERLASPASESAKITPITRFNVLQAA